MSSHEFGFSPSDTAALILPVWRFTSEKLYGRWQRAQLRCTSWSGSGDWTFYLLDLVANFVANLYRSGQWPLRVRPSGNWHVLPSETQGASCTAKPNVTA